VIAAMWLSGDNYVAMMTLAMVHRSDHLLSSKTP
jgi:hypothetical protein